MAKADNSNTYIEGQLDTCAGNLEKTLDGDVLSYVGDILYGTDKLIRDAIEERNLKRKKLVVVLETGGGYIEVAQRMAETFRHHYDAVEFVIPDHAMSAGTVLVMSGDAIYMDYFSVLGPIDPQVERYDGKLVPALGYLEQYRRLIKKSQQKKITTAELHFLVEKFDPAELYQFEQARELSVTLLKQWLVTYKFKNWKETQTRKKRVTQGMKVQRAEQIARELQRTERWHSHGRGISMAVLVNDLNLLIEDFGKVSNLNDHVRSYYRLMVDYMGRRDHHRYGAIHAPGSYRPFVGG